MIRTGAVCRLRTERRDQAADEEEGASFDLRRRRIGVDDVDGPVLRDEARHAEQHSSQRGSNTRTTARGSTHVA